MKIYLKSIIILLLESLFIIIFLSGCITKVIYDIDNIPEDGILLTKWYIIGPFDSKGSNNFLNKDNLKTFGLNEASITYKELSSISVHDTMNILVNDIIASDNFKTDFNLLFDSTNSTVFSGNVYCGCILKSHTNKKLKLNFSTDDGSKVWLNNTLIYDQDRINSLKYYDNYIDLDIKKGKNFLLIKINNIKYNWEMFAVVENETLKGLNRYKRTLSIEYGSYYLKRSLITNDSLCLNESIPNNLVYLLHIKTANGEIVHQTSSNHEDFISDISNLADGLHNTNLIVQNDTFNEVFFKGNIFNAIDDQIKELRPLVKDEDTKHNIDALIHRYNHLMKPENRGSDNNDYRNWDKKIIYVYSGLKACYDNVINANKIKRGILKSYISKIDKGIQYYQLFIPDNYNSSDTLPLVIELPKFMNRHPSPLETYRFANIRLIELFSVLANRYNMIILDPGCRTVDVSNMNTIEEADLWENIEAISKYINIDSNRIFLRGACLSSRDALKLAVKYPDRFAAISITAPELKLTNNENIWLQQNEPLNYLKNLIDMPLFVIHSRLDPHMDVSISEDLIRSAKEAKLKYFTYNILPLEIKTYYSEEYMPDIFDYFSKFSIKHNPDEVFFSTSQLKYNKSYWLTLNKIIPAKNAFIHAKIMNDTLKIEYKNIKSYSIDPKTLPHDRQKALVIYDNGKKIYEDIPSNDQIVINPISNEKNIIKNNFIEGPFAHVFTQGFIIVPGTIGHKEETDHINSVTDTITKYWELRYYNGCLVKPDIEISKKDLAEYNLVLIGTNESNLLLKRMKNELPYSISKSEIKIGNQLAEGENLGFYFIYPNPENHNKYLAVIGYNNADYISLGYEKYESNNTFNDISNYGWYDYKIWDALTNKDLVKGYFNSFWE